MHKAAVVRIARACVPFCLGSILPMCLPASVLPARLPACLPGDCHFQRFKGVCVVSAILNYTQQLLHPCHRTHDATAHAAHGAAAAAVAATAAAAAGSPLRTHPHSEARNATRNDHSRLAGGGPGSGGGGEGGGRGGERRAVKVWPAGSASSYPSCPNGTEALLFLAHFMGDVHQVRRIGLAVRDVHEVRWIGRAVRDVQSGGSVTVTHVSRRWNGWHYTCHGIPKHSFLLRLILVLSVASPASPLPCPALPSPPLQPLHVGFSTDHGGNLVHVSWFGRHENLHAVRTHTPSNGMRHAMECTATNSLLL